MAVVTAMLCVLVVGLQTSGAQTLSDTLRPQCAFGSSTIEVTDANPVDLATWPVSDMLLACLGYLIVDTSSDGMKQWCTNTSVNNVSTSSTTGAIFQFKSGSGQTIYYPVTGLIGGSTSQLAYHYDTMQNVSLQIVAPALQQLPGCKVSFKFAGTVTTTSNAHVSRPTTVPFLVHTSDYIIVRDNEVTFYFATPGNVNNESFGNLAAVVPISSNCGNVGASSAAFNYNESTNLSHITPLPIVSWSHTFLTSGNYYLCTNFSNGGWSLSATLLVFSDNPAYFTIAGSSTGALYIGTEYSITFVGKSFDLRPGGDRFKVVSVIDGCEEASPPAGGVPLQSDLGPSDAHMNISESIGRFKINSGGSYLFCYFVAVIGRWTSVYNYDTLPHTAQGNLPALPHQAGTVPGTPQQAGTVLPTSATPAPATTSSCAELSEVCPDITTTNPVLVLVLDRVAFNDTAALEFRREMDQLMCVGGGADPVSILLETRLPLTASGKVTVALGFQCESDTNCARVGGLSRLKCILDNAIESTEYESTVISVRVIESSLVVESDSKVTGVSDDTSSSEESHGTFIIVGIILGVLLITAGLVGVLFYGLRRKTSDPAANESTRNTDAREVPEADIHSHNSDNIPVGIQIITATEMETIYSADVVREPEWGRGGTYQPRQQPTLTVRNNQTLRTASSQSTCWADLGEETKDCTPVLSVATSENHVVNLATASPSRYTPADGADLDIPIDFDGMS